MIDLFKLQESDDQLGMLRALQQGVEEKEEHWSKMIGTKIELNADNANKPTKEQKV